ncbi:unnamed protein product [Lactuca virosa]|uniref:Uncharacterized protein n=1 Tax=Lactuca virosa TaxID=75947 RepID=A0AAU9M467_9ASTR|nr:unnamed protein product [Lactuca virosa]
MSSTINRSGRSVEERVNRTPDNSMQRDLKVVVLSSDSKKNMKTKVNVKKFATGKARVSKSKTKIRKQKCLIESVDMAEDNEIHKENELRTKRRFDSCKIKGDEVVVLNSCSGKHKVTVKKLNEDEDSDFEDAKPVLIRKKRMHYTSFKDDDKENVNKLKRQKNKEGNVVKARKMPKVVGNDEEEARRIQVRTSPNVLYSCMHNLSKEQEAYISSIGLGHLLNMKVDGCASIMGHYTVRNFDADRMVLNLHHGDIPINRQVIHEMLGLPLENVTIKSMAYREVTDDTITVWKKQFDDEDNIRPRAVQQVIMQTTRADLLFKVNIFVLLCNTLGQSMSMGTCDLSMLSKVTKDLDLSDIDWCGYVFDCLKETKSAWNPNSKKGFYVGPIILLLTTISTIKEMHDMLVQQKKVLEDKINDAVKKYPKNQLVKEWKNKVNDLFNEVSASEEPEQSQWWYDNKAEIERTLNLATSHKQFDYSPIANCSIQMSKEYADFVNRSGRKSF